MKEMLMLTSINEMELYAALHRTTTALEKATGSENIEVLENRRLMAQAMQESQRIRRLNKSMTKAENTASGRLRGAKTTKKTVSIGFIREDDDLQLLATLNDNDDWLQEGTIDRIAATVREALQQALVDKHQHGFRVELFERQDAPDYVSLDV
jgi:hypothetical protein